MPNLTANLPEDPCHAQMQYLNAVEAKFSFFEAKLININPKTQEIAELLLAIEELMLCPIRNLQNVILLQSLPVADIAIDNIKILCNRLEKDLAVFLQKISENAEPPKSPLLLSSSTQNPEPSRNAIQNNPTSSVTRDLSQTATTPSII